MSLDGEAQEKINTKALMREYILSPSRLTCALYILTSYLILIPLLFHMLGTSANMARS